MAEEEKTSGSDQELPQGKISKKVVQEFIEELSEITSKYEQSTKLYQFYYTTDTIDKFNKSDSNFNSAQTVQPNVQTSVQQPSHDNIYPRENIDTERKKYIQSVIFALQKYRVLLRGKNTKEKQDATDNAIYIFQLLNDISTWETFKQIFITDGDDNLGNTDYENSYPKLTEISITNVPNIMAIQKTDDNAIQTKPLTNVVVKSEEKYDNSIQKIIHNLYTAEELFQLFNVFANQTDANKETLHELDKKKVTRTIRIASDQPNFSEKENLNNFQNKIEGKEEEEGEEEENKGGRKKNKTKRKKTKRKKTKRKKTTRKKTTRKKKGGLN
jgi:hypothetical protein